MRNADNIWIPSDIECIRAKYICDNFFSGGTPSTSDYRCYENGDIPWIASGKCQDCKVVDETAFITKYGLINSSTRLIKPNSTLMAMTGATCGKAGILKIEACANQSVFAYELNHKNDPRFLFYSLIAGRDSILLNQLGGAQAGINGDVCKNVYLPKFDLAKQKVISDFLEKKVEAIEELIKHEESSIEKLLELRKSIITSSVSYGLNFEKADLIKTDLPYIDVTNKTWQRIRIKDNTYLKGRIGWQGLRYEDFIDAGPYCITGTDFTDDSQINWETCYHVSEERYKMDAAIQVRNGDLLITKDGTVGKLAFVEKMPGKACLNSHLLIIRVLNNAYNIRFLYYVLKSKLLFDYLDINKNGTVMDSLTQEMFENFQFFAPSIEEQEKIVEYLDKKCRAISELLKAKEKKIEKLKEYKKSLIYECVTGRRKV